MSAPDRITELFEQMPTRLLAEVLRGFDELGRLDEFREWFDDSTYDPARSGGRGRFSEHVLMACSEAAEFGSDPGEVLRALVTGDQLAFSGASTDLRLRHRLEALRPGGAA